MQLVLTWLQFFEADCRATRPSSEFRLEVARRRRRAATTRSCRGFRVHSLEFRRDKLSPARLPPTASPSARDPAAPASRPFPAEIAAASIRS